MSKTIREKGKRNLLLIIILLLGVFFTGCKKEPNDNGKKRPPITVEELTTEYTDDLRLTANYLGKKFVTYGIGAVSLLRVIDGDTAHFSEPGSYDAIKVRFLGVNTPESTISIAPWGYHASDFVTSKLENAYEIVIEANEIGSPPPFDTTGGRYLGYVWYRTKAEDELRLLNLEIIEQCFSYFTGGDTEKYFEVFKAAFNKAYDTKLRVFGEEDPTFNYSREVANITIAELRNNYSSYSTGQTLKIKALVIRKVGKSLYLEDLEDTLNEDTGVYSKAGVFLYHSFTSGLEIIEPGDVVEFECQATDAEDFGTQLVNPKKVKIREQNREFSIRIIDDEETSLKEYEGLVVKIFEFEVTSIGAENEIGAYTIRGKMKNGTEIQVRVDGNATPKLNRNSVQKGQKYNVIGGVGKYVDYNKKVFYQINLGNITEDTLIDFVLSQDEE